MFIENVDLEVKTRYNTSPRNKPNVYISYCHLNEDRMEHIVELILKKQDCAVYYYNYANGSEPDTAKLADKLDKMNLIIIPVTAEYLNTKNQAYDFEFYYALKSNIPVLPILQDSSLATQFNEKCNNIQFLDEHSTDRTEIPFDIKLELYLSNILIDPETAKKIQAAFDVSVFLSYRKRDRAYAQELMGLIHNNPLCREIAIWYDEFLVAGEPFDVAIEEKIKDSELFLLLVTPNLLTKNNYIIETEYPVAVDKYHKTVLAVEYVLSDKKLFESTFRKATELIQLDKKDVFPVKILSHLQTGATENNSTAEHNFFIGLSYLGGICTEKNYAYAVEYITDSATKGLAVAQKKLADMYYSGEGVKQNAEKGNFWQKEYIINSLSDITQTNKSNHEEAVDKCRRLLACYFDNNRAEALYQAGSALGKNPEGVEIIRFLNDASFKNAESYYENILTIFIGYTRGDAIDIDGVFTFFADYMAINQGYYLRNKFFAKKIISLKAPSITSVGFAWFAMPQLKTIDINNSIFCSTGNCLINKESKEIVLACEPFEIPVSEAVKTIGCKAFTCCKNAKRIALPDNITTVKSQAFSGCVSLEEIVLNGNLAHLESCAFSFCDNLKKVVIFEGVTEISAGVFEDCSFSEIVIPDTVTKICHGAFKGCANLTKVIIPDSVTDIEDSAFCRCISLKEVYISDAVEHIGEDAFHYCEKLEKINMPVCGIGLDAFAACCNLQEIRLESKININDFAYYGGEEKFWRNFFKDSFEAFFYSCRTNRHIALPQSFLPKILIPDGCKVSVIDD